MTQAFYTAISGINANQSQLVVVSDNIANMNTTAFKSSRVTFSDVYYSTSSVGSPPTTEVGGTNPEQIGSGVTIASIDRDFTGGTVTSTGITTDCNIQGNGFFVVQNASGEPLYTRAGNFTIDSSGNLTLPNGYKVIGATNEFGTVASTTPLQIPQMIDTTTVANTTNLNEKNIDDLNNCNITSGDFTIKLNYNDTSKETEDVKITLTESDNTLAKITKKITDTLLATDESGTSLYGITANDIKVTCDNTTGGKFKIELLKDGSASTSGVLSSLEFGSGSSNFLATTELKQTEKGSPTYSTKELDYKQIINAPDSVEGAKKYSSISIAENGVIEIGYSNGDKLSVYTDDLGINQFKYTTSAGIVIKGDGTSTSDVQMSSSVLPTANLQIQLAQFMNPNGLVAEGSNLFAVGQNSGTAYYGVGNSNAFGSIQTGGLESSNVDISTEFANMITAQRAVEANSRIFDTANQIMKTLVYLGS